MKALLAEFLLLLLAALGLVIRSTQLVDEKTIDSSEALKNELIETRRRLREAEEKLATQSTHIDKLQMRSAGSTNKEEKQPFLATKKVSPPSQTRGPYRLENDAVVYDSIVKLHFANDVIVSSPTGVMVSDLNQKMVVGDLTIETPDRTMQAGGAVLDVSNHSFTADSITITMKKKDPNKSVETTEDSAPQ